jgi:hypothetical protein
VVCNLRPPAIIPLFSALRMPQFQTPYNKSKQSIVTENNSYIHNPQC